MTWGNYITLRYNKTITTLYILSIDLVEASRSRNCSPSLQGNTTAVLITCLPNKMNDIIIYLNVLNYPVSNRLQPCVALTSTSWLNLEGHNCCTDNSCLHNLNALNFHWRPCMRVVLEAKLIFLPCWKWSCYLQPCFKIKVPSLYPSTCLVIQESSVPSRSRVIDVLDISRLPVKWF